MALLRWEGDCPGCTKHLVFDLKAEDIDTTYGKRAIVRDAHFYTCACGEKTIIPAGLVSPLSDNTR